MIISGKTIKEAGLVEGLKFEGQIQPAGVDLTVKSILGFDGMGVIDGDNSKRRLPVTREIEWNMEGCINLESGSYKIIFNEIVKIPIDCAAIARPRSSLLRCGVTVNTAVWDPGYNGRSEALLVVSNPSGIRIYRDAKLIQIVFIRMQESAEEQYSGEYQGENIEKKDKEDTNIQQRDMEK